MSDDIDNEPTDDEPVVDDAPDADQTADVEGDDTDDRRLERVSVPDDTLARIVEDLNAELTAPHRKSLVMLNLERTKKRRGLALEEFGINDSKLPIF